MPIRIVVEQTGEAHRGYCPDLDITQAPFINWDRASDDRAPAEVSDAVTEADYTLAENLFSIRGIAGIVLWPRRLEVRIVEQALWQSIEPKVLDTLTAHLGGDGYTLVSSFQDPAQ